MRWTNARPSVNVEDRRSRGGRRMAIGGGLGTIIFIVIAMLFGADPLALLEQVNVPSEMSTGPAGIDPDSPTGEVDLSDDPQALFVANVLGDTEETWQAIFRQMGQEYDEPVLVLYRDAVHSACGFARAAVGPFYCPGDSRVYLDLSFFDELKRRFHAPGDFAQAYVIAHEVGHHIQNLMGISDQVHAMRGRVSQAEFNQLSVRLELQADFLAGVWAHHADKYRDRLEDGDIEEGLRAASAIGDDTMQKRSQGRIVPDSFTHGTSQQRVRWFKKGYLTGDISQGDTFSVSAP